MTLRALPLLFASLLLVAACAHTPSGANPPPVSPPKDGLAPSPVPVNVFRIPQLMEQSARLQMRYVQLMEAGQFAEAESVATNALDRLQGDAGWRFLHARALVRLDRPDDALTELEAAVSSGFRAIELLRNDKELQPLADSPRFAALLRSAEAPNANSPAQPLPQKPFALDIGPDLVAQVTESNTVWDARSGMFQISFNAPSRSQSTNAPLPQYRGPAAEYLTPLLAEGRAAGNWGDLYENRDHAHSRVDVKPFPGLATVVYGSEAVTQRVDHGLARALFSLPTLGNASLAATAGPTWRSLPRFLLIEQPGAARLALSYFSNNMHFYPEHRDHDPQPGDVYPANTPYLVLSQGSSGSDRPFLRACFATLAAFPPETKQHLVERRHLMPTLQRLLRSTQRGLSGPEAYFTGAAHPVVFNAERLDPDAMVRGAQGMKPEDLVPVPILRVLEESTAVPGTDYFDLADEKLFDTPCAVARVFRTLAYTRSMTIAVTPAFPPPEGATWRWSLLQGDPAKVRLVPVTEDRALLRIEVDWHPAITSAVDAALSSDRVDIGCFLTAPSGQASAPSILSIAFLRDERRIYAEEAPHRLLSVDYTVAPAYVDPLLTARRDWRDEYHYDADGRRTGWMRHRGQATERFTSDGCIVAEVDGEGSPTRVRAVRYRRQPSGKDGAMPTLLQDAGEAR